MNLITVLLLQAVTEITLLRSHLMTLYSFAQSRQVFAWL